MGGESSRPMDDGRAVLGHLLSRSIRRTARRSVPADLSPMIQSRISNVHFHPPSASFRRIRILCILCVTHAGQSQRAYAAAEREAEAAKKREIQAYAQAQKASAADQKRFEKEAKESHYSAMAAEVERLNLELSEIAEDLEGILAATLDVDDFLDLKTLKAQAIHPPFLPDSSLLKPRPPLPVADPVAPTYVEPTTSKLYTYFFGKKNHKKKVAAARANYETESEAWRIAMEQVRARRIEEAALYEEREIQRLAALQAAHDKYAAECAERDQEAANQNCAVDALIANLGYGIPEAIEEYIGIVLSNAIYPDHFPIEHEFSYVPDSAELTLRVSVPSPDQISMVKAYKYTKATDGGGAGAGGGARCEWGWHAGFHR